MYIYVHKQYLIREAERKRGRDREKEGGEIERGGGDRERGEREEIEREIEKARKAFSYLHIETTREKFVYLMEQTRT